MKEYLLIMSEDYEDFIERVDEALSGGWTCQGGVAVNTDRGEEWLYQAMVKEIAEEEGNQ